MAGVIWTNLPKILGGVAECAMNIKLCTDCINALWDTIEHLRAEKPTEEREKRIKELESVQEQLENQVKQLESRLEEYESQLKQSEEQNKQFKRLQEQLKAINARMMVDSLDVVFNRDLTEDEMKALNNKDVTEHQLFDLVSEYDQDYQWRGAEWHYDRFTNNFDTEEGIDVVTALLFGYAVGNLFREVGIKDLYVEEIELSERFNEEDLVACFKEIGRPDLIGQVDVGEANAKWLREYVLKDQF